LAVGISLQPAAAPSPAPSVTASAAPKPTPLPSIQQDQAPGVGPFLDATISVPSWGPANTRCATGQVKLTGVQYDPGNGRPLVTVLSSVTTDVDGDGTPDYVAHLACGEGPEGPGAQIVAFRRSGARLVPIARVIGTQDGLALLGGFEARGGGQIAVQVAAEYTDSGIQFVPNQWRVYALQGGRFRQVAGATSFPADPPAAALSIITGPLTFSRAASGYVGDLTVTVANTGPLDVTHAELTILAPVQAQPAGDGWTGCAGTAYAEALVVKCPVADLIAGSTRQLHFRFVAAVVPARSAAPVGPENHDHYVTLSQLPPYVFEHITDALEAPFPVIAG